MLRQRPVKPRGQPVERPRERCRDPMVLPGFRDIVGQSGKGRRERTVGMRTSLNGATGMSDIRPVKPRAQGSNGCESRRRFSWC